jgi:small subunit ribosomal protein S18
MKKKSARKILKPRPISTKCLFCEGKSDPSYKAYSDLFKFISDRARIYSRERTGTCAKHQRILAREIKRARLLGLLPFTGAIS